MKRAPFKPKKSNMNRRELGQRLRQMRLSRKFSLAEASAAAGLSPSFLSHVETGKGDITFLRLHRLVQAYGMDLMDIVPPTHAMPEVVRARERSPLTSSTEGMSMYLLGPDTSRLMIPVLGILEPGAAEADYGHHDNENFIHVLKGALKISFKSGRQIILKSGDSIYLDSHEGRKSANASRGRTVTLGITVWRHR